MNLIELPMEILFSIFEYLDTDELLKMRSTCKYVYTILSSDDLPASLFLKLNPKIIQANALLLWTYPKSDYQVIKKYKLVHIDSVPFFAKFFKWCSDERLEKKMKKKMHKEVNKAVEITFREIYRLNKQGYSIKRPSNDFKARRLYVWDLTWFYSNYVPADYPAKIILNSERFNDAKIHAAAKLVEEQGHLYEKNHYKYYPDDNHYYDERICWHPHSVEEALFNKNFLIV